MEGPIYYELNAFGLSVREQGIAQSKPTRHCISLQASLIPSSGTLLLVHNFLIKKRWHRRLNQSSYSFSHNFSLKYSKQPVFKSFNFCFTFLLATMLPEHDEGTIPGFFVLFCFVLFFFCIKINTKLIY